MLIMVLDVRGAAVWAATTTHSMLWSGTIKYIFNTFCKKLKVQKNILELFYHYYFVFAFLYLLQAE